VAQVARKLDISIRALGDAGSLYRDLESRGKGLAGTLDEQQEIERLRKRLVEAEEELEIIKNMPVPRACK
jgi:transposase-like protein